MEKKETIENMRKRLIFRSGHRGTKEMDLIMGTFALQYVPTFACEELKQYEEILNENDPDLYSWITNISRVPMKKKTPVMELLLKHKFTAKLRG